jgi:hypothetical protein
MNYGCDYRGIFALAFLVAGMFFILFEVFWRVIFGREK